MSIRPIQGDEKHLGPATTLYKTAAISFVIPSEAEGSAVSFPLLRWSLLSSAGPICWITFSGE